MHIAILHEDQIPDSEFDEFENSIRVPGLVFERESRPSGTAYAGIEWLMPTAVVAYVAKPYFESFLKEIGKDHYDLVKKGFKKLYKAFAGDNAPNVQVISTAGKSSKEQPYSLFFSVIAEIPDNVRLKLLIPRPIEQSEYEAAISKFLSLVQNFHAGTLEDADAIAFKEARVFTGTVLTTYEAATGQIVPVDPLLGRHPKSS